MTVAKAARSGADRIAEWAPAQLWLVTFGSAPRDLQPWRTRVAVRTMEIEVRFPGRDVLTCGRKRSHVDGADAATPAVEPVATTT